MEKQRVNIHPLIKEKIVKGLLRVYPKLLFQAAGQDKNIVIDNKDIYEVLAEFVYVILGAGVECSITGQTIEEAVKGFQEIFIKYCKENGVQI